MLKKIILYVYFLSLYLPISAQVNKPATAASNDAFRIATEDYLRGNYSAAVRNLRTAFTNNPQDQRISSFMQKVILEAGNYYYMRTDYNQAREFLSLGRQLFPQNTEILQLYNLTNQQISRQQPLKIQQVTKTDQKKDIPTLGEKKSISFPIAVQTNPSSTEKVPANELRPDTNNRTESDKTKNENINKSISKSSRSNYTFNISLFSLIVVGSGILFFTLILIWVCMILFSNLKHEFQDRIIYMKQEIENLHIQVREACNTCPDGTQVGVEEQNKTITAVLKELDTKLDRIKENLIREGNLSFVSGVMSKTGVSINSVSKKTEINVPDLPVLSSQPELLEQVRGVNLTENLLEGDTTELNDARNRMVKAAVTLYQSNPSGAIKVLNQTIETGNLSAQISAVYALGEIGTEETTRILTGMLSNTLFLPLKFAVLRTLIRLTRRTDIPTVVDELVNQSLAGERKKQESAL